MLTGWTNILNNMIMMMVTNKKLNTPINESKRPRKGPVRPNFQNNFIAH